MKYNLGYNLGLGIIERALPGGGFCSGCVQGYIDWKC